MKTANALSQTELFPEFQNDPTFGTRDGTHLNLDPIDATFRDSARAPLHSWFPYLEGYSPRFVERVRHEYLRDATRIIEPFAGTGTTPIVLGQAGVECLYSEANPAMAFIIDVKLAVLRLPVRQRRILANQLHRLANEIEERMKFAPASQELRDSYLSAFGQSIYFNTEAFEQILRLRSVNDAVQSEDSILGNCLALAVLASLIPTSLLKRAGDLRYRTPKELTLGVPTPLDAIRLRLISQAHDLASAIELRAATRFACANAASLKDCIETLCDGVITSPPYLNGTNYIRNARLELWYLGQLQSKNDLRLLRDTVVTSGINDVDARTDWHPVTDGVKRVVEELQANSYDDRIAKMVGGYFRDMQSILSSLVACTRPRGKLCIDIGDSIYGGTHVPTDDLLIEVAEDIGLMMKEQIYLRKRKSKGGLEVRQQLIVFESPSRPLKATTSERTQVTKYGKLKSAIPANCIEERFSRWRLFKAQLPHQKQPYAKREWGGSAHSMCSYQGKIKPALAHHLVDCFSNPGDIVVDPFSGAGTIPFEACRMGRRGFGIDISRLGYVLTRAKVAQISRREISGLLNALQAAVESYQLSTDQKERASAIRFNSAIPDYYHPDTFREVIAAREFFLSRWGSSSEWAVLLACTLHLLHGNRPYALSRRSHPVTPFKPTGPFEYRTLMPRLHDKLARLIDELDNNTRLFGDSCQADCTIVWPDAIPTADVIITSPPFFDSTRFYSTNWIRFWFAGWERDDFDSQTGAFVENRQKKSFDVYRSFFEASRERISKNGLLVLHLGQSAKCDMAAEIANRAEPLFSVVDRFVEGVEHCESHGVRDKGTVSGHSYLVLKPS